jgi:hypothetical protein
MRTGRKRDCIRRGRLTKPHLVPVAIHCIVAGLNPAARARHEDGTKETRRLPETKREILDPHRCRCARRARMAAERVDARIAASLNLILGSRA